MSLRLRLNMLMAALFVVTLVLGAVLVIYDARRAVLEETTSTAQLAVQLLNVAFSVAAHEEGGAEVLTERLEDALQSLARARHLVVRLVINGQDVPLAQPAAAVVDAPQWFASFVTPRSSVEFQSLAMTASGGTVEIFLRADPGDEISESWADARTVFGLIVAFALLSTGLLYVVLGRWLRSLDTVVAALDDIQQGDYRARMPLLGSPELRLVSERFNLMAEVLEQSREENRRLTEESLAIQEAERRALAQELHDDLGQSISAIKAVAASIDNEPAPAQAASGARTIIEICDYIYASVRGMMRRLRPVLLDEFGLVRAVEDLVDGWNERHADSFCRLATRGPLDDLSDAHGIGIYRIVQEGLTNVTKHSLAAEVTVAIERITDAGNDRVRVEIRDDGVGFDPATTRPGLGLLGMRERVAALSGRFELRAAPQAGVEIQIELPLEAKS